MSSIPQGAFAACKLRELDEKQVAVSRMRHAKAKDDFKNDTDNAKLAYGPDKYHEKLMISIWGLYNRYSPHNIKSNEYNSTQCGYILQQHNYAVAPNAIAEGLAMAWRSARDWEKKN